MLNPYGPSGDDEPQAAEKKLSPKQLEAKLKREASKHDKATQKEKKKEESARKREAKAVTKKVVSMSSKLSAPLAAALHKACEVYNKAEAAGLSEHEDVVAFGLKMQTVENYKKKTAEALSFYSKNPACELAALPFDTEKQVTTLMKDLAKDGMELKKKVIGPAKGK